jgi:hypothetical protein
MIVSRLEGQREICIREIQTGGYRCRENNDRETGEEEGKRGKEGKEGGNEKE